MTALRTLALTLGSVAVATFATVANAFPIASSGEGASVLVGGTSDIVATYQGNSASFSNDLYLMWDGAAGKPGDDGNLSNDVFIFNNHSSASPARWPSPATSTSPPARSTSTSAAPAPASPTCWPSPATSRSAARPTPP